MSAPTNVKSPVHERLVNLVCDQLRGQKVDLVGFGDALLGIAADVDELRCTFVNDGSWHFDVAGQDPCEFTVDRARSKLRAVCARLAVLSKESGHDVSFYGGDGAIKKAAQPKGPGSQVLLTWKLSFKNTPGEHEFTLTRHVHCDP